MEDWCSKCEVIQEFLPVGYCPVCGAENLMMENATSTAICKQCGESFGIPKARKCFCHGDLFNKQYTISFIEKPQKEFLLRISKIIGRNVAEVYQILKAEIPQLNNLTYFQAYDLMRLLSDNQIRIICIPSLKNYREFETCWHHLLNCCP